MVVWRARALGVDQSYCINGGDAIEPSNQLLDFNIINFKKMLVPAYIFYYNFTIDCTL